MINPSISIFFPAYNDAGTISSMVISALITVRKLTDNYEIIVINDASVDYTGEVLAELAQQYDCVRIVTHETNRGYGGALRSGFANATKELIFYTDGDAQYDARELTRLMDAYRECDGEVDLVNGYKISRSDPLYRIIIGRIYQSFVRWVFGIKLRDPDCDFRLMRRSMTDKLALESDTGVICVEMMKKIEDNHFRVIEVPVHHYNRVYGHSQIFNFPRLGRIFFALGALWMRMVVKKEHLKDKVAGLTSQTHLL